MARRSRNHTFLPIVVRVIALAAIGFVVYRYVGPRGAPLAQSPVQSPVGENTTAENGSTNAPLTDGTTTVASSVTEANIMAASNASTASVATTPTKKPSSWFSFLGLGGQQETEPTAPPTTTDAHSPGSFAASGDQSSALTSRTSVASTTTQSNSKPVVMPPPEPPVNPPFSNAANGGGSFSAATGPRTAFQNASNRLASGIASQKDSRTFTPPIGRRTAPGANVADAAPLEIAKDGHTAQSIVAATRAAYQKLSSYTDAGQIELSYRLDGQLIQEQQPFATSWDVHNNRFASKLFSTELACDGKRLSCLIYHIDTENFDNQQLVIPVDRPGAAPPISRLIGDPFARAFMAGTENWPLIPPRSASDMFALPPVVALLSGQVASPWVSNNVTLKRQPDQTIKKTACYVVDSTPRQSPRNTSTLWIDKSTQLIRQIRFPKTLVLPKILHSSDVTDIELLASFPNQQINVSLQPETFAVKLRKNAQPVTRFVRLPDSMVSDSIGKSASQARFIDRNGDAVVAKDFTGKITTIVWLGDDRNVDLVDELARIKKTTSDTFSFNVVFTPGLADSNAAQPKPVAMLRQKERLGVPLLFDDGTTLSSLNVKSLPALLVLGRDGRVQFSQNMADPQWPQSLTSVLQRLSEGEDIAKEMMDNYVAHYRQYGEEIERVSAKNMFANSGKPVAPAVDRGQRDTSVKLTPNKKWELTSFKQPGNIMLLPAQAAKSFGNARYAVFDGAQTVKFIDQQGRPTGKVVLKIDGNPPIRVMRYQPAGSGSFVGFERMGAQVHVFDSQLQLTHSFPGLDQRHTGILDVQPVAGAVGQFLISFNDDSGVYLFDATTGTPKRISDQIVSTLATGGVDGGNVIGVVDGQLFDLVEGEKTGGTFGKQFHRLIPSGTTNGQYAATVRSAQNTWSAIGLSSQMKTLWSVDLRSQLLQNPVEPIAVGHNAAGETFWAVVDDERTVCLISGRGTWLGDWKSESAVRGLALSTSGEKVDLVVSTADSVVAWALNYQAN